MGADDFILGDTNKDFKNLKAYQDAIQMRDWQTCDHISENQELYFLKERFNMALDLIERAYPEMLLLKYKHYPNGHEEYIEWQNKADEILKSR